MANAREPSLRQLVTVLLGDFACDSVIVINLDVSIRGLVFKNFIRLSRSS